MSLRVIRKTPDHRSIPAHLVAAAFSKHKNYTALGIFNGKTVTFPLSDVEPENEEAVWKEEFV